ncbi:hypothetical protein J4416_03125 [Candidatus Pacearchaeota archaeon]|nr:hypothetical protein [Candidatus Pacearchaeota archaeon]
MTHGSEVRKAVEQYTRKIEHYATNLEINPYGVLQGCQNTSAFLVEEDKRLKGCRGDTTRILGRLLELEEQAREIIESRE